MTARERVRATSVAFVLTVGVATGGCAGSALPPRPAAIHTPDAEALVQAYYQRVNTERVSDVMALLVPEPVIAEPFSHPGAVTVHTGYASVWRFFDRTFRERDDQVVPEFVRAQGGEVTAGWAMHGADGEGVSGVSRFQIRSGQIARIDIEPRE